MSDLTVTYTWIKEDWDDDEIIARYYFQAENQNYFPYAMVDELTEEGMVDVSPKKYPTRIYNMANNHCENPSDCNEFDTLIVAKQYCEHILLGGEPPDELKLEFVATKLDKDA